MNLSLFSLDMTEKTEKSMKKGKVFLIDGNSFCYRAFYAIQSLATSQGEATNAIYGVVAMLRKILKEESPEAFAVSFDLPKPTFRHEKFADYKIHRKPMPDGLIEQIPKIKEIIRAYRIPIFEKEGFEADDVLGTLATRLAKLGYEVFIVTGDKDALQLVSEKIRVYSTHKEGLVYDEKGVCDKFEGLGPDKVVELMALMGDASDNIPGVPHIGPKTALALIKEFGSLEGVYGNLNKVKSESQRNLLAEGEKLARLSHELATIDCNVPLDIDEEELCLKAPDAAKLTELFKRYEFRSLLKEMAPQGEMADGKRTYQAVADLKELEKLAMKLGKAKELSVDTETTSENPHLAALVGLSFSFAPLEAYYVPVKSKAHQGEGLPVEKVLGALKPVLEDPGIKKLGQNIKYDLIVLKNHGIHLAGLEFDTMLASYLINPAKRNHNLDDIAFEYLDVKKIPTSDLMGKGKDRIPMDRVPLAKISEYACEDADCVYRLKEKLMPLLKEREVRKLFSEVEMPLAEVLADIEMNGVAIDARLLGDLSKEAEKTMNALAAGIYKEAGEEFNINSTKQLAEVLFTKLHLPPVKKTKTGFSTDVEVLEKLAETHQLPKLLLEYREHAKLKSTYFDALPEIADARTGLIHTSFNQTGTVTGRLSSSEPNLQNIPVKTELGRKVRKAFVPRAAGRKILSADYSQIELRFLAHFSSDPALVKAFGEDEDVHSFTASLLYGVKLKDVTREMRNLAKVINFSIIYGKTAYGLSKDLQISIGEAETFIRSYFERYPKVKEYLESQKELARQQGFVTTILGRRAYFPEIKSANANERQFAERAAINAPLQGSAADLIKVAMIRIHRAMRENKSRSLMILQVHDELVFDFPENEEKGLKSLVGGEMESALKLGVPLKVDFFTGDSWYKG